MKQSGFANSLATQFWLNIAAFRECGLRFNIEENFLDGQSNGCHVQRSEIRFVRALSRLWLILAVAVLYLTQSRGC